MQNIRTYFDQKVQEKKIKIQLMKKSKISAVTVEIDGESGQNLNEENNKNEGNNKEEIDSIRSTIKCCVFFLQFVFFIFMLVLLELENTLNLQKKYFRLFKILFKISSIKS